LKTINFLSTLTLLTLVSCQSSSIDFTVSEKMKERLAPRCLCMPEAMLVINSFQAFPENLSVRLDDRELFNTCEPETMSSNTSIVSRTIKTKLDFKITDPVELIIADYGPNCSNRNDAIFFSETVTPNTILIREEGALPALYHSIIEI
jgi:hypothetical protein